MSFLILPEEEKKMRKNLYIYLMMFLLLGKCVPNDKSSRDRCKDGDGQYSDGRITTRDSVCILYAITLSRSIRENQRNSNDSDLLGCLLAQIELNKCDERQNIKLGISTW